MTKEKRERGQAVRTDHVAPSVCSHCPYKEHPKRQWVFNICFFTPQTIAFLESTK